MLQRIDEIQDSRRRYLTTRNVSKLIPFSVVEYKSYIFSMNYIDLKLSIYSLLELIS